MERVDAIKLKRQIEAINTLTGKEVLDCRLEEPGFHPHRGMGCEVHVYKHEDDRYGDPTFRKIKMFRYYAEGNAWVWAITHTIMTYTSLHPFEHPGGRILQDVEFHVDVAIDLMRTGSIRRPRHAARLFNCPKCDLASYIEPPKPREAEDSRCTTLEQSFTCPACGYEGTKIFIDGMAQIMDVLSNNMDVTPQV